MFGIHVAGGTGAGTKRPLLPANTVPWACKCEPSREGLTYRAMVRGAKLNPGYLVRCIDCGTQRP